MKVEENWFKIVITILGIFFVVYTLSFLKIKNTTTTQNISDANYNNLSFSEYTNYFFSDYEKENRVSGYILLGGSWISADDTMNEINYSVIDCNKEDEFCDEVKMEISNNLRNHMPPSQLNPSRTDKKEIHMHKLDTNRYYIKSWNESVIIALRSWECHEDTLTINRDTKTVTSVISKKMEDWCDSFNNDIYSYYLGDGNDIKFR